MTLYDLKAVNVTINCSQMNRSISGRCKLVQICTARHEKLPPEVLSQLTTFSRFTTNLDAFCVSPQRGLMQRRPSVFSFNPINDLSYALLIGYVIIHLRRDEFRFSRLSSFCASPFFAADNIDKTGEVKNYKLQIIRIV